MRGIWAGLATMFFAGMVSAQGVADNGQSFPSQVGGIVFGTSKAQFESRCTSAGGSTTATSGSYGEAGVRCSVVPEAPTALPPPLFLTSEMCNGAVCELDLVWTGLTNETLSDLVKAMFAKYGVKQVGDSGPDFTQLRKRCEAGDTKGRPTSITWLFTSGRAANGAWLLTGSLFLLAWCGTDGKYAAGVNYQNSEQTSRRLKANRANY